MFIHREFQCRAVERDEAAIAELMRMSIRGDERAVEALSHGCHYVGVGERPGAGEGGIGGDRRPVQWGEARTGLQRHERIRRGAENDGRGVGGRCGDVGEYGGLRHWQTATIAVVCNPGSESQSSAVHRAAGIHHDGLIRHYGSLEHGECSNSR